jgi:DNA-binding CsgD family transcriptional regulator
MMLCGRFLWGASTSGHGNIMLIKLLSAVFADHFRGGIACAFRKGKRFGIASRGVLDTMMAMPRKILQKKIRELLSSTEASLGLALGCSTAWIFMCFQSLKIVGEASEYILDQIYLISLIVHLATFILAGVFHQKAAAWLENRAIRLIIPAGAAVSTMSMFFTRLPGFAGTLMLGFSGITSGVFTAQLLLCVGSTIWRFPTKNVVAIVSIGYVASTFLFALFSLFSSLEASVFASSMPIATAFLITFGLNTKRAKKLNEPSSSRFFLPQSMPKDIGARRDLNRLTRSISLCIALVGCANEMARTIYMQEGIIKLGEDSYAILQGIAALAVTLGAVGITLALLSVRSLKASEICYRVVLLFLALGVLLLPAPLLYPQLHVYIPYAINSAAYQCISIMMLILTCGLCYRYQATALRSFAFIRVGWDLGPFIGIMIGRLVISDTSFGIQTILPAMVAGVLILLFASSIVFTQNNLADAVRTLPLEKRRRFQNKCLRVAEKYHLSRREREVMILFAKGRNLAFIQNELSLSKSTVSTHRQNIYRKLDVHTSQEMIDLIQQIND